MRPPADALAERLGNHRHERRRELRADQASFMLAGNASTMRSMVLAAPLVCSVAKTRWPVSAALMAASMVQVAHFADQDHVRVLAERAAERLRKKLGTSTCTSRCVTTHFLWSW